MREDADHSSGQHEAATPEAARIRYPVALDADVFLWFQDLAARQGADCGALVNEVLRDHLRRSGEPLERTLRRVLREELRKAG